MCIRGEGLVCGMRRLPGGCDVRYRRMFCNVDDCKVEPYCCTGVRAIYPAPRYCRLAEFQSTVSQFICSALLSTSCPLFLGRATSLNVPGMPMPPPRPCRLAYQSVVLPLPGQCSLLRLRILRRPLLRSLDRFRLVLLPLLRNRLIQRILRVRRSQKRLYTQQDRPNLQRGTPVVL